MRLYLAVAVLMLALVAYTGAQPMEETFEQKLSAFGQQVADVSQGFVEKAKTQFQTLQDSDAVANVQNWFQKQMDNMKEAFQN